MVGNIPIWLYVDEYSRLLELQKQYEDGIITEKDMTIEEMEAINQIYSNQIKDLSETLSKKLIQKSQEWYK